MLKLTAIVALLLAVISGCAPSAPEAERPPNIVVVITDDQGYGDVGVHGNSKIRTPNLDALHAESIRLTDYHVDPTCAPTRSALMSGRYSSRTGVWHTIMGRSLIAADEVLLPQMLSDAGYATGMFGKWHLGDNYPFRPEDRGFHEVVRHGGGGVQQTPDYWGNDYFDDTYWRNGEPQQFTGYCTDVFFSEATRFIEETVSSDPQKPFFAYIPTNAPHGPFFVAEKYSKPYAEQGVREPMAQVLRHDREHRRQRRPAAGEARRARGSPTNTIFIFITDNGTAAGVDATGQPYTDADWGGFNAQMRGKKGSEYDGGHRVPFFLRWPNGELGAPRDIDALAAHVDILPTLLDLAGAAPATTDIDGKSLAPLLKGDDADWPERTLLVHSQRIEWPEKWRKSAVMTEQWRLINGEELYDIASDPGQEHDLAGDQPAVVEGLRNAYEQWWDHIDDRFEEYIHIPVGTPGENPTRLTAHDWHPEPPEDSAVPWNQPAIQRNPATNGYWMIEVPEAGEYEFELFQWDKPAAKTLDASTARVAVGDQEATGKVESGAASAKLTLDLPAGKARLQTWLTGGDAERGAFFVYVTKP